MSQVRGLSAVSRVSSEEAALSSYSCTMPCTYYLFLGRKIYSCEQKHCVKGPKAQSAFARSVSIAVWSVADESMSVSPSAEGEGSRMALGADCEMFIQLRSTGMYPAGEEKCSKPIYFFFPKLLFFQTLSGELAWWICKWLLDFISFKIIQGFA